MKPLTECEEELLVFLKDCERCPSTDEMARGCETSQTHL